MQRLHTWDKDDTILTLYYVKHDLKGLPVKDEKDLAEGVIGSTKASLVMQAANVRYVLGYDEGVLDCFSEIQKAVVDEYNTKSPDELKEICVNIISKRDINGNIDKVRAAQKAKEEEKQRKIKELLKQQELEAIFRRMGKDPAKMKKVTV
jgi:hypothetical protein